MVPVTDLSIARVHLPELLEGGADEDELLAGCGGGDVLLFRAGDRCWAALCRAPSTSRSSDDERSVCPADLADALEVAARDGLLVPVSTEAFEKGPEAAAAEALRSRPAPMPAPGSSELASQLGKANGGVHPDLLSTMLPEAGGDGAVFRPFRFPTKMSDAFRLPWSEIGVVTDDQLRNFYEGTQMRSTPTRVIGAVGYIHHHYLRPFKQKIISKGRHLLVIKISETTGRRPQRRCLTWWMPLAEVRERYADPKKAELYHEGGSVHRVCQLVETYKLHATVPIHFEIGERPRVTVGGFPLHCFDLAVDFHTRWSLGSDADALLEEKREVQHCIATNTVLEMSAEARKAEKRRRKRQNKKAREQQEKERNVTDADNQLEDSDSGADEPEDAQAPEKDAGRRAQRAGLMQPNEALRDSSFLSGLLEQMRQRKVALVAEKSADTGFMAAGSLTQAWP